MTYSGLSTLALRLFGLLTLGTVLVAMIPAAFSNPPAVLPVLQLSSLGLLPGVILIVASKPLGRLLAAGIE